MRVAVRRRQVLLLRGKSALKLEGVRGGEEEWRWWGGEEW